MQITYLIPMKNWAERHMEHLSASTYRPTRVTNLFQTVRCFGPRCTMRLSHCCMDSITSCVAQLAERRSLAGELTLSCARPAADGWPLCGWTVRYRSAN